MLRRRARGTLFPYTTLFRSRAPWTTERPTAPQPMTATRAPSQTPAVFSTEPTPVATLQPRSEEHTSELQSRGHLVCRLLLEKKKKLITTHLNPRDFFSPCAN